jgi:hypothetical protein
MSDHRTSIKRIGLIVMFGIVIGGPIVFVATHGVDWEGWESASRMARELRTEIRAGAPFTETAKRLREYRVNRNKWQALGLTTYEYEFTAHCACSNGGRHVVKVRNGAVTAVIDADTMMFVPADDLPLYDTIEQRFEIVRDAIRYGADKFTVSYDPETGIPVRTEYDYRAEVIDDEGWNAIRLLSSGSSNEDAT